MELLSQDLKIQNDAEWTFISDRQKVNIFAQFQNMHKEFKGVALRQLLWKAARSTTDWEFNLHMNKMKEV